MEVRGAPVCQVLGDWRLGGLLGFDGNEFDVGSEVAERSVAGEKLVDLLKGAECWILDGVFWKELAVPVVAELEADRFEKSIDALPGVEAVMIFVSAGAR